jgi:hypothetical protein
MWNACMLREIEVRFLMGSNYIVVLDYDFASCIAFDMLYIVF